MSYTTLFYHIVYSTKGRRPALQDDVLKRVVEYTGGIARNLEGAVLLGGGATDHLHLATSVPPALAVSDFIRDLKSNTSGWVHDTLPEMSDFAWQEGYAAFSVSPSVMPNVKRYIEGQAEHHKTVSFEDELIALLKKHGIEYDERYVFG